jgi:hypothetical protein
LKDCPYCANQIQDAAIKCQFCGERLDALPQAASDRPVRPKKKGWGHPLLLVYLIAGVGAYAAAALYLAGHERMFGAAAAVGAAIVFIPAALVAWAIGDFIRRFASPSAYFVSGGAMAMAQTRLYWMVGPQSVAVFVVFAALGVGVLRASMPDMMDKPAATAASSSLQPSLEPGAPALASGPTEAHEAPVAPPVADAAASPAAPLPAASSETVAPTVAADASSSAPAPAN